MAGPQQESIEPVVAVFPLANVVFFPTTSLPLHIFEPRYRRMVADARDGSGMIAMGLLRETGHDDAGDPAIHPIGTLGRIEELHQLGDGRFNIRLRGLRRVRFDELTSSRPYRLARCQALPEAIVDESAPQVRRSKLELLASIGYLRQELTGSEQQSMVLDDNVPLEQAVNEVCAALPVEPCMRQSLLAENDLLVRRTRALEMMNDVLETVLRIKSRGTPATSDSELN
jgi:Lon protease-like protein